MTELGFQKKSTSSLGPRLKYSKRFLHYSNLDPQYFAKTRPKIIHNLAISQLALESISSQIQRKLIQTIKNIKCSHILKLRLGHSSSKNMRKVIAPLRAFKSLHTLKLDFFGFPRGRLRQLRALPKRLASTGRRLENLRLDFTSSEMEFYPALHLTCLFLKRQIALKGLSAQFQQTLCGNSSPLSKRLKKYGLPLTDLSLDFSQCYRMKKESIHDLTSRGLSNLPNLKRLSLKLGTPFAPLNSSLAFNLEKSKDLISFNFDFQPFYTTLQQDMESLARQLRDWSSSLKDLHIKFPKADPKSLETLAESLADLKAVKSLKLEFKVGTLVTQDFMESFAKGLKALEMLEILHLEMNGCALDSSKLEVLTREIEEKRSLRDFKFSFGNNNGIDQKGISYFFNALKGLKELEALNLSMESCGIDNSNIDPLASSIERLTKLKKLKLCLHFKETDWTSPKDRVELKELEMRCLSGCFSKLPHLATLKLNLLNIKMNDKDQINLVENIKKMEPLRKLELFFNGSPDIGNVGLMKKLSGLGNLPNLQDLSLNLMKPSQEDLWDLFHYLESMKRLRGLRVGFYQKKADFNEAMERYSGMMKSLGGGLKSFEMIFYRCDAIESDFTTDLLRGLEELKQAENVRFELVQTGLKYYDAESQKRVAEKMVNMRTLKKFYYGGNDIV